MAKQDDTLIEIIDDSVRTYFYSLEKDPEEYEVRAQYEQFYDAFSLVSTFQGVKRDRKRIIDKLVFDYCSELNITKRLGFAYMDEESKPWLNEAEASIEEQNGWFYWTRYKKYLLNNQRWARDAVRSVERDSRSILDLMANPQTNNSFERRGLVVASVQSGKTANYIGLICRAADAGYRIIIVMAGVHNVLRNQTQARIEDGFTGFSIEEQTKIRAVGVGLDKNPRRPISCTSREADFNKNRANALKGIQTSHTNEPWLFVIKKNSNSLKQVYEWLRDNANPNDQLLLIDDEADNASINGKYRRESRDDEPTRINGQIRNILNFFTRKCYVGYTATPFANILIDPTVDTSEFGKDLFPSSFIYTLEESSDYFGATKVFEDIDDPKPAYLRRIYDIDAFLPPKHKSTFPVEDIPESLRDAIRTFVLATAIRSLRGDGEKHSTMMVNVSPYTAPQRSVARLVNEYVNELQDGVRACGSLPPESAIRASSDLDDLRTTWLNEYEATTEFDWPEVQKAICDTIRSIHVVSINTGSPDRLEYDLHTEHVIAIGGYRLSRGLTLEGLVVSYISRNVRAFDALMQTSRWFGYRPRYEDLCRIWMSDQAAGWYKFVADATDDLWDELRDMRQANRSPRNYGLKIMQSPDSLIVTARNKLGTGTLLPAPIDLNNGFIETVSFDRRPEIIENNRQAVLNLLQAISNRTYDGRTYRDVPVNLVIEFIRDYINEDARSPKSQTKPVLNYIDDRRLDGELGTWDVYVASGEGTEFVLPDGHVVQREIRYPGSYTSKDILVVGEKQRLASRGIEKHGLSQVELQKAEEEFAEEHPDGKNVADRYYRMHRTRPLLVVHPVLMKYGDRHKEELEGTPKAGDWDSWDHEEEAYGWSISFPHTDKQTKTVNYIFNQVALDNINADFTEDSDDDYDDD